MLLEVKSNGIKQMYDTAPPIIWRPCRCNKGADWICNQVLDDQNDIEFDTGEDILHTGQWRVHANSDGGCRYEEYSAIGCIITLHPIRPAQNTHFFDEGRVYVKMYRGKLVDDNFSSFILEALAMEMRSTELTKLTSVNQTQNK